MNDPQTAPGIKVEVEGRVVEPDGAAQAAPDDYEDAIGIGAITLQDTVLLGSTFRFPDLTGPGIESPFIVDSTLENPGRATIDGLGIPYTGDIRTDSEKS